MSAPPERHRWQALPAMAPYPADNPPNPAKIALGKRLFNDRNLSLDRSVSCASCHNLYVYAGADGKTQAEGIGGQKGVRNTPTVWNSAFQRSLFWDGRSNNLEHQALQPILNPIEMGLPSEQAIVERVRSQADYHDLFFQAFGERNISSVNIAKALASYERTLITNDSPYDDFVRGDRGALKQQQLNGMVLFEQLGCVYCHAGPNFSVASVYSEGLALRLFPAKPTSLTQSLTLNNPETGKPTVWRVPSLRNVALTGPWLHNGSVDTLEEVVRMMAESQLGKSGHRRVVWSDNALSVIDSSPLTDSEVRDIVAFLKALSSKRLLAASETQNPPPNISEP
ncbi:cytochrome c peroxidase [Pseudoteredinibacter isoporae]